MIIAVSRRVKVSLSVCVHFKSYYLEVDAVTLSKYMFTNPPCLSRVPIAEMRKEQQADSPSTQLVTRSSFYLLS